MKGENFKAKFFRNVMPVVVAAVVMALILVTVPLTSTPARVFGGYGWADRMSDPTQWNKYASVTVAPAALMSASASSETLATVTLDAAAIQGNDVNFAAFTLDGVPVASWALVDGEWVLNFKLAGLYAAGDVVTLSGKYTDDKTFTVSVTVK